MPRDASVLLPYMHLDNLHRRIISVARSNPPSDTTPYAFEKRVMAAISSEPAPDIWALWSQALWKAAVPCVALSVFLSVWTVFSSEPASSDDALSADIESTVMAQFEHTSENW